MEQILELGHLS